MSLRTWGMRIGPLWIVWRDLWKREFVGSWCFEVTWKHRILVSVPREL